MSSHGVLLPSEKNVGIENEEQVSYPGRMGQKSALNRDSVYTSIIREARLQAIKPPPLSEIGVSVILGQLPPNFLPISKHKLPLYVYGLQGGHELDQCPGSHGPGNHCSPCKCMLEFFIWKLEQA